MKSMLKSMNQYIEIKEAIINNYRNILFKEEDLK